jgi:hypothetical protein
MTHWTVSHATTEEDWTRQYLSSILTQPCASAASQAEAHHRELDPGVAHVWATGGSLEDRRLAEQSLVARLAQRGIERAVFTFDPEHKTADWNDIMNKARRLIDSGHVHMVRNGYNNIVSHVWGDHGDYDVEIGRDDPNSRAITSWTCDCPWDQFAWQRTRQWKKYEGRPCAHVLATFWQSQMLPIDEEGTPGMNALKTSPDQMQLPFQFGPTDMPADPGAPVQGPAESPGLLNYPQGQPAPPAGAPQPAAPSVLPPFPGEQMQLVPPGQTPMGQPIVPGTTVSLPGARQPTPFNPTQNPSTYSKVAAEFNNSDMVQLLEEEYGVAEGKSEAHGAGRPTLIPKGSIGEVLGQDPTMGWVDCIFVEPMANAGPMEPYHVRAWIEPSNLKSRPDIQKPGPAIRRR